ncbi:MAG: cytochrome c oxidase assembly protein [Solirubrobacteraceae bacterium]
MLSAVDSSWTFDPAPVILLIGGAAAYAVRFRHARQAARAHKSHQAMLYAQSHEAPRWRAVCFAAALLAVAAALLSPVDRLGEQVLVMHMVQHLLLLDVAPILAILGFTRVLLRPATRRLMEVERAAGFLAHPVFAALLYITTMVVWHIPALYDAALEHPAIHVLEHVCFAIAGGLYWWHLLSPIPSRHRLTGMGPVLYMVGTKIGVGLLGIVITFAPESFYSFYDRQGPVWGMSPSTDQQVAGALMAVEQSVIMGIALAWLFTRMLSESQRSDERSERHDAAEA